MSALPPEKLKFFDEAGVHTGSGNPVYGNSLKGQPAVEVIPGNHKVTLNLLCGLEGVLHANTVDGALDSTKFLNFFGEAGQATTELGSPVIEFGDYIILYNCSTHRYETGNILLKMANVYGSTNNLYPISFTRVQRIRISY